MCVHSNSSWPEEADLVLAGGATAVFGCLHLVNLQSSFEIGTYFRCHHSAYTFHQVIVTLQLLMKTFQVADQQALATPLKCHARMADFNLTTCRVIAPALCKEDNAFWPVVFPVVPVQVPLHLDTLNGTCIWFQPLFASVPVLVRSAVGCRSFAYTTVYGQRIKLSVVQFV